MKMSENQNPTPGAAAGLSEVDETVANDSDSADSQSDEESVYSDLEREAELEALASSNEEYDDNTDDDGSSDSSNEEEETVSTSSDRPAVVTSHVSSLPDEYEYDSSDEEDLRNTIGNVPVEWYEDLKHIGYDLQGKKLAKPMSADELDTFLEKMDNPDYWKTVMDEQTGRPVVLSDEQISIIQQIAKQRYPDPDYNAHEPWVDFFTKDVMIHPITRRPQDKKSFIPSLTEREKVGRLVHAIKMGWLKPKREKTEEEPKYYNIWETNDDNTNKRQSFHIAAPKMKLPGHEESYNPPPEYLLTKEEREAWEAQEPEERKMDFLPQQYDCLRHVPAYSQFIKDRFERCLDLYLCPRQQKMRVNVDPDDLLPKLPKPSELQPYPSSEALVYRGHSDVVRCVSVDPSGHYIVSGSDDCSIRTWELRSGRCLSRVDTSPAQVHSLACSPNANLPLLAATLSDRRIILLRSAVGDKLLCSNSDEMLSDLPVSAGSSNAGEDAQWSKAEGRLHDAGVRIVITLMHDVGSVRWHNAGDYFVTVQPRADSKSVIIHHMSKARSQCPFRRSKGLVQCVLFHPTKPYIFVASQRYIRIYNLIKQQLTKKLLANCKWISSMDIHPGGDNVIIGSYDCRLSWFDLDLSTKPYQTLRHHKKAIRQVRYHGKYPLFASASDDGTIIVCHGMVYNDLLQNALIVPVKILRGHSVTASDGGDGAGSTGGGGSHLGVMDTAFHPTQPWLVSAGADHTLRLYT